MTPYGYQAVQAIVQRELDLQAHLAAEGAEQVLFIPAVMGPVGSGKTAMARSEARRRNLPLAIFNVGETAEPSDILGFGWPPEKRDKEDRLRTIEWCLQEQAGQATKEPCLLLFDDVDKAPPVLQGAMLNVMGNRCFRTYKLHPGTLIMCAGNNVGDDAFAQPISESLRGRITPIAIKPSVEDFTEYGTRTEEIHPSILGFLQWRPDLLHNQETDSPDVNSRFPSPRGWWEASQYLFAVDDPDEVLHAGAPPEWHWAVQRKVGEAAGNEFWSWYTVVRGINVVEILTGNEEPPTELMLRYAAVFAIAQYYRTKKVSSKHKGLPKFIQSLEKEQRVAFAVQLDKRVRVDLGKAFPSLAKDIMEGVTL